MGDASIIARLLANGHVQYGWSGNGGYFSMVGIRLLLWYQEPKKCRISIFTWADIINRKDWK